MQFKLSALAVLAVSATLAAATPTRRWDTIPASQCTTGPVQCCDSTSTSATPSTAALLGLLGIVAQGVDVLVGLTCSPISVIGIAGNSCSAQPVCCTNNSFKGVVALGCTPVNLNL